jgi:hypothetical protein
MKSNEDRTRTNPAEAFKQAEIKKLNLRIKQQVRPFDISTLNLKK